MIRFSAGLVVVAIGVLVGGVATSKLLLVYIAIGLSVAALIALAIGVVLKREELFGERQRTTAPAAADAGTEQPVLASQQADPLAARVPATASVAAGEAAARDSAAQSPFDQPGYGQAGGGYGRDVFGQPARQAPAGWDVASPREPLPARDWSARDTETRQGQPGQGQGQPGQDQPERPGADTPSPARHGWAFRQDSPWTLEPPAASAPAAPPAPTSPAPASPVPPPPVPPSAPARREKLSPPHGESFNAPAVADYLRQEPPASPAPSGASTSSAAPAPAAASAASTAASPPDVASSRAESATPAPTSPARDWPSWFERPARPAPDESAPEDSGTEGESGGTDAGTSASSAAPTRAEPILTGASTLGSTGSAKADDTDTSDDDDDWWPRRSWLLDDESGETSDATASAPEDSESEDSESEDSRPQETEETEETVAETAATPTIPIGDTDAAKPHAEDDAPADRTASESDGDNPDDASDAALETSLKQITVVPGVPRYHEANCILIRFMTDDDVQKMTVSEAAEAGCTPCRACQPDEPTA
ncbi:MAG TPA: hypothetical protein VKG80_02280 [Trebonia sp.]|nr:hypothetical protein [Trebonia sp.]